jgi:hypothetical protein
MFLNAGRQHLLTNVFVSEKFTARGLSNLRLAAIVYAGCDWESVVDKASGSRINIDTFTMENFMKSFTLKYSLIALAITGAILASAADARPTRSGSGAAVKAPNGQAAVRGQVTKTGQQGTVNRSVNATNDGQGNVRGSTATSAQGVNGGSAQRAGQFQRNADGSYSRTGSGSATGANGGTAQTSGSVSGDGQGNFSGSRQSSATGANGGQAQSGRTISSAEGLQTNRSGTSASGGTYSGNVSAQQGSGLNASNTATSASGASTTGSVSASKEDGVTRTRTCTNTNGEVVACK